MLRWVEVSPATPTVPTGLRWRLVAFDNPLSGTNSISITPAADATARNLTLSSDLSTNFQPPANSITYFDTVIIFGPGDKIHTAGTAYLLVDEEPA